MTGDHILSLEDAQALYAVGDAAHDFDHVKRVARMAVHLAEAEGADPEIVRLASLLHDVPASTTSEVESRVDAEREAHHLAAAQHARAILLERGIGTAQADEIVHCIEAHRFRERAIRPQTIEAKCVYDADKLDSMGAIGIARACAYAGAHGGRLWTEPVAAIPRVENAPLGSAYTPVHEYVYKLRVLLDSLYTDTARHIGRDRHAFMEAYFRQLDEEMMS